MNPLFPNLIYDPPCPPFNEDQRLSPLTLEILLQILQWVPHEPQYHLPPPFPSLDRGVRLRYQVDLRIREVIQCRLVVLISSQESTRTARSLRTSRAIS
ncbi:First part of one of two inversely orientated ORFs in a partial ISC1043 [Saccharolobus solfataricus P2]|uniref:First part of one of two inversely orientated ORFs in a partial ISC1043 n=2 Tax=Saccharolobus solfataricus TaxID=2287 RepID=Q97YD8_SACS2|nr:First part of one of two inversely orientated ORFs in a partial ISC1043 [Saccharolobus solfataricus P2]SAI85059.1 ORF in partial transposon ISC1043 [Saccharolobus solfataricus]